jgi:group I intron endonuclease
VGYIYAITNKLNNKSYVGLTTRHYHIRWLEHVKGVQEGSFYPIHRAIRKHGFKAFKFKVLEVHDDVERLNEAEVRLIKELKTFSAVGGYNLTTGGGGIAGWQHTVEAREKISLKNRGKIRTSEMRKRTSEATKKAMQDPVIKQKCASGMKGKRHRPDSLKKMSASRSGDKNSMKGRFGKNHPTFGKTIAPVEIVALDDAGNIIHEFVSIQSAKHAQMTPSAVWAAIKKKRLYRGLLWMKRDDFAPASV